MREKVGKMASINLVHACSFDITQLIADWKKAWYSDQADEHFAKMEQEIPKLTATIVYEHNRVVSQKDRQIIALTDRVKECQATIDTLIQSVNKRQQRQQSGANKEIRRLSNMLGSKTREIEILNNVINNLLDRIQELENDL